MKAPAAPLVLGLAGASALAVWAAFLRRWSITSHSRPLLPPPAVWWDLLQLAAASQPILRAGGVLTSGYRSAETNAALKAQGSVENSLHLVGRAADFIAGPGTTLEGLEAVAWSQGETWRTTFIHNGTHLHVELSDGPHAAFPKGDLVDALLGSTLFKGGAAVGGEARVQSIRQGTPTLPGMGGGGGDYRRDVTGPGGSIPKGG